MGPFLCRKDHEKLHGYTTEHCFPMMTDDNRFRTIRWQFIKSLEAPRVVHARCTDVITKQNIFAQVGIA